MIKKAVLLDFGYVIGFPVADIDRKYLYMDWNGIHSILNDRELKHQLWPSIGSAELEAFFEQEIYNVFVEHEKTDCIDPQSNTLLLKRLHLIFRCPVTQLLVDMILAHIDTMKYITIDPEAVKVIAELKHRGYQIALVSNMMLPGKLLKAKLQEANALSLFDNCIVSSDVGYIKPHPKIFLRTLESLRLRASDAVFVGDTYQQDIIGAKLVGLDTIWLNTRHEPQGIATDNAPDHRIETLSDLITRAIL
jgi:HAD superfamily hydrolase (TIGR01509 family)